LELEVCKEAGQIFVTLTLHPAEALQQMSAFHAFCSELPYAVFPLLVFHNTLLALLWSFVA
jgi:hypothetical protein